MVCTENPLPYETEVSTRNHADTALLHDLNCWREQLARSIVRNNLGMRSELITTAVNRIVFSLIFLRIAEDRGLITCGTLQNLKNSYSDNHTLLPILKHSQAFYQNDPRSAHETDDHGDLVIEDHVLTAMLTTLTSVDRRYDLAVISLETLSQVFSRYLTKTIRRSAAHKVEIVDAHAALQPCGKTILPLPAVGYMVMSSLAAVEENRSPREILPIRVVDPACGAGTILLFLYRNILENTMGGRPTFDECREVLNDSIHGLDINRHAVAVTRMLLFFGILENRDRNLSPYAFFTLSEEVFRDLRHTIRCGNALVGPEIIHDESWMFCPSHERRTLNMFDWHIGFPEVFAAGGFDAVISNPPEGLLEDREWIQQYFQRHYHVYHPLADRSGYFIEKGVSLLRPGGTLSCILSDRWLRGSYGSPLRMLLRTKQIEEIVSRSIIEKSKPGSDPCILRISNRPPVHPFSAALADILFYKNPDDFIRAHRFLVDQTLLDDGGWALTDTRARDLLNKVNRHGVPLNDFVMGQVHTGIETGYDEGFVIDARAGKNLIKKDRRYKKLIRPFVAGNDIGRYYLNTGERSIIFIPQGWTKTHPAAVNNPWKWFKQRYPFLARRIKRSVEHTGMPAGLRDLWWESTCSQDFWLGTKPKILFRDQFEKPEFAFDEGRSIADPTVRAIASSSLYLLGLLNSRLFSFLVERSVQHTSENQRLYSWEDLRSLPVYIPDFEKPEDLDLHDRLVALVKKITGYLQQVTRATTDTERTRLKMKIASLDEQIDLLVYELYGLTKEEIKTIENSA